MNHRQLWSLGIPDFDCSDNSYKLSTCNCHYNYSRAKWKLSDLKVAKPVVATILFHGNDLVYRLTFEE